MIMKCKIWAKNTQNMMNMMNMTFEDINDVEDLDTLINTYQEESNSFKEKYNNEKRPKSYRLKYEELDSRIRYAKWLKEKRS